jgi:membrane fusion protein, multidrug efflux system
MRSLLLVGFILISLILTKIFILDKKKEEGSSAGGKSNSSVGSAKPAVSGGGGMGKPGGGAPISVDVMVATLSPVSDKIYATGTLAPNEQVEMRSEASGIIKSLFINEGTFVKQGQLIAKIKDDPIRVQLKKLEYEQQLASQIEARQKKLLDINAISKEEYDLAVNKINTLSADKDALQVALSQTEVRAPFAGYIGLKAISVGAYVTPAMTIATLVQTHPIKVDFSVPERYTNKIKIGTNVSVNTEAGYDGDRAAKVIAIDPTVDETLRTLKVRGAMPNTSGVLKPGMFVRVDVPLGTTNSVLVPTEAFIPFAGGKKIFLVKDGKSKEITVTTGLRNDKSLEIINGVSVGDSIIISGLMNVKDGQSISPKSTK